LTAVDLREIRKRIAVWRRIYKSYDDVRDRIFAHNEHNEASDFDEINKLFKKTNITEMKRLFAFLSELNSTLWEAFHNGRKPLFGVAGQSAAWALRQGEKVHKQGHAVLKSMLHSAPDE
jgi:hypothetical protein